eukprot:g16727.t1
MADTAPKKSYPGEFRENAARCVISFPGKYPSGWDALVKGHHDSSIGCVFFTTPGERGFGDLVDPGEGGLGDHVQDPEAEEGICYCKAIYGERSWEKFHYLKKVKKENLKEELEKAKVTKIHVVEEDLYNSSPEKKEEADKEAQQKYEENKRRAPWGCAWFPAWMKNGHKAVEQGQKLQVVFFAGQKGKGKVHWNDLPGSELWNGEGLGGSQKGEVAYLDKMWRETNNPAWIYEEIDVMQFLQGEFNLEQEVDARDMAKNWRRGHIVGLPVAGAADDKEWVPKWTVQCNKDLEKFESTFLMHTVEPIDKLLKEVGKDNLSRMLEQHLPKGVDLDVMFASRCRLENGHAAFAVNVRVPHVKAIHMLRDQVLCGDLEAELNRSLADIHQKIDKDGPRDDDRFETSIWDTDSNQTKSTSQTLAFDPRIDQVLGRILEELPGGESTPGLEARKEIDHTDGKSQAGLARYFEQKYKQGGDFEDEEYERDVKDWCWVHKPSGIKVWQDAIDLSQSGGSGHCVFHYTTGLGFRNITNTSSKVAEVFASLITAGEKANALWGAGVYTVRKTPDEWPSIESLLDNMYRNMLRRDIELKGHEHAGEERLPVVTQLYASRVAYCIPIIADAAILYDVSVRPTPEMVEQGRPAGVNLAGKLLNEPGKPVRSVIVVRVENEEENYVSNAYANLLPTMLDCGSAPVQERLLQDWVPSTRKRIQLLEGWLLSWELVVPSGRQNAFGGRSWRPKSWNLEQNMQTPWPVPTTWLVSSELSKK